MPVSLTREQFHTALRQLHDHASKSDDPAWRDARLSQVEWSKVQIINTDTILTSAQWAEGWCLRLTRRLSDQSSFRDAGSFVSNQVAATHDGTEGEVIDEETDLERLDTRLEQATQVCGHYVTYDIMYSASYEVPVLYLHAVTMQGSHGLHDDLPSRIIPDLLRAQVFRVGVMGAITMADHPRSGMPAYLVHPCATQDAMAAVCRNSGVEPLEYVLKWLGLVGGVVGLYLPQDVILGAVTRNVVRAMACS